MARRWVGAVLVSAAAVSVAWASVAQASRSRLPLSAYLVQGHEETGMHPTGKAVTDRTPAKWTADGTPHAAAEDKRLAQEVFSEVISVQTASDSGDQGVSWAMVLGSASAAAREEAAELKTFTSGSSAPMKATRFKVAGVAGAEGWAFPGIAANVLFTEGHCLLLVGDELSGSVKPPVIAATQAIWARTHRKPGAC
jgi:hypothetical protein